MIHILEQVRERLAEQDSLRVSRMSLDDERRSQQDSERAAQVECIRMHT